MTATQSSSKMIDCSTSIPDLDFRGYLGAIDDQRREALLAFHDRLSARMHFAHGSRHNHQAWPGGYADHITEMLRMALVLYSSMGALHPMPFNLSSALLGAYFHDIEKVWLYSKGMNEPETEYDGPVDGNGLMDKMEFLAKTLPLQYGIQLTDDELHAVEFAHGESDENFSQLKRAMSPLASFVHCLDNMSARMWFDQCPGISRGPSDRS